MIADKFFIVIPTRNRHDTLRHAIRTCLAQDDRNLEIIVSDNFSSLETAATVAEFSDSRLKYQRADRPLCMMDSWEFGLSGVTGSGYVHFMGDDNGILPGTTERIREILGRASVQIVHGKPIQYIWPQYDGRGGVLQIPAPGPDMVVRSASVLKNIFALRIGFDRAPTINACFVHTDVIAKARNLGEGGRYFRACNPDVYSAIVNAYCTDRFAYLNRAFFVNGGSRHSNGMSAQSGAISRFVQDNLDSGYSYHRAFPPSGCYVFNVCEAMAHASDLFDPARSLKLDYGKILKKAVQQEYLARGRSWLRDDLVRFAQMHGLKVDIPVIDDVSDSHASALAPFSCVDDCFHVASNYTRLDNVYDAAVLTKAVFASGETCFFRIPLRQRIKNIVREKLLMGASLI